ncbi:MAG: hypothetical protein K2M19_01260 [Muribaculaceae bacterium]|nr:hypothetical protein [Muribaculaceae bacterium]
MTDSIHTPETVPGAGAENATATAGSKGSFVWLAILSLILTLVAWIAGSYSGIAAIAISAAAIVAGAFALRSHRRGVRNTAITSIIAAAVLLVVVAAFMIVIYMGLKAV